ncbi:hypothetical protein RIF29_14209 [Crotalaria pallida]|uniref:protein-serine/threonine phosphatase n=1 Tax=Crotalaria pallida TaxID=3830 RepID=A0AAN9II16_CROPI
MVFGFDCEKKLKISETEIGMTNEVIEDVEEGEISDSDIEEISEEDFKKPQQQQQQDDSKDKDESKPKEDSTRVWAVHDLYSKYPDICRGYASGLYNLAWAQGVQNKPLNDIFVMDVDSDANVNANDNNSNQLSLGSVKEEVVIDLDKEDGELEEGEIDADANPEGRSVIGSNSEHNSVAEVLEGFTTTNVEQSFAETCRKLQSALQSMDAVSEKDENLVRLSFKAIEVVYSVFCSMENSQKEQFKDNILRLLSFMKDQQSHSFTPEHLKEIQVMINALDTTATTLGNGEAIGNAKEMQTDEIKTLELQDGRAGESISSSKPLESIYTGASDALKFGQSNIKGRGVLVPLLDLHKDHDIDSLPSPTREAPYCFPVNKSFSVGEGINRPGLPMPTQETPIFPVNKSFSFEEGMISSGFSASKLEAVKMELDSEGSKLHPYVTDAWKAVSSYQQKFGRSSFLTSEKLPSPTPSGDCDTVNDTNEEVSSASVTGSVMSTKPPSPPLDQLPASSASTSMDRSSMNGLINSRVDTAISGSYLRKPSAKPRDPRLRFINSDASALDANQPSPVQNMPKEEIAGTTISRKQKAVDEPSLDVAVSKRLKTSLENPKRNTRDPRTAAGNGGWLEETTVVGPQLIERNHLMGDVEAEPKNTVCTVNSSCTASGNFNLKSNGNQQEPVTISNTTASIPAMLKDLVANPIVNPTMLLNLLIEQQRLSAEAKKKSADSSLNALNLASANSAIGTDPTMSIGTSMTTGLLQNSVGMLPVSSQATTTAQSLKDDSGKIRMKPRDPRRILHGSTVPKSGSLGSEQFKANIVSPPSNSQGTGDHVSAPKLEVRADNTKLVPSQPIALPDIAGQFTKNLKNIADIISVSQESSNHSPAQTFSSAPVLTSDRMEQKSVVPSSQNLQATVGSAPETCASVSSTPQSTWRDVEHLFEGYDEKQKAAIQRERARRIEEQNKMFATRKLCLVLDLDHTLLNSAKFVEVDPVHDEILRKKEEQDREKPHRHLFRFPHMGMWTKLRPGIWNFLEKASKLYELHLYTMGNKLYATEMAKVLDPKGTLFAGRVISKGDDTDSVDGEDRAPKTKDLEGVLGMESAVVIIDDSVRVWPHNKLNLIVVERYTYFPISRRQFGLPGPSLLEIDHDERPEAGTLASSLGVIERIHKNFFASQSLEEVDVRNILATEQRKILAGCRIVFSRVFPVGEVKPHLHPLWQTAEQFGAVCTNHIDDQVTHVVANSLGTDKVNWALSTGKFVVHPGWVEASALLYRRANEQDFAIKP